MTLLVLLSLVIALVYLYTDWLKPLKAASVNLSTPFYWMTDLPGRAEQWADNRLMSKNRLLTENESLRTELRVHKRKLQRMAALQAENVRLRQLLNSADSLDDRVLIAELIGVSPDPAMHKVILNRGHRHGVYLGQALLDANGLMGQVVEVGAYSSQVLLITDSSHALPVQINRNGLRLIAQGVGDLYELHLRHVSNTQDIREGDILVSSGLGQRFPVGYPVARVIRVETDSSSAFANVVARPMAELNRSRHVLLVFDHPPASDEDPKGLRRDKPASTASGG